MDRVFRLIVEEIKFADPDWSQRIAFREPECRFLFKPGLPSANNATHLTGQKKISRKVERNKREKHTVPWRYVILRLHEAVQEIVPHLNEHDHTNGSVKALPGFSSIIMRQSLQSLFVALSPYVKRESFIFSPSVKTTKINESRTVLKTEDNSYSFDVFIDARGQRPLKVKDIPFPGLREQLQKTGDEIPDVGEDYTLQQPEDIRGRVAFGALPWLMHDQPFVQDLRHVQKFG